MSIEKKYTTLINEKIPMVYEAGKKSMIDESKILKNTASGSFLQIDDASELPHNVEIQLSHDTVTDYSSINVTKCEKNLVDINAVFPNFTNEYNGITYTNTKAFTIHKSYMNIYTKAAVTISADYEITTADQEKEYVLMVAVFDETGAFVGNSPRIRVSGYGEGKISFTCSNVAAASFSYDTSAVSANIVLKNIQIEVGNTATEYEQYRGQTLTTDATGTVTGIKSSSPYMNIFSDVNGINITATYHKSWGMQKEQDRFYNNFKNGSINKSISFEWIYLIKDSIIDIVKALSNTATGQTLILKANAVNAAFETTSGASDGSTTPEWKSVLATKPNWTITLL